MSCSAQDTDAIVDDRLEFQAIRLICQTLRTQDHIHLTTLKHRAKFMDEPRPHLDDTVWVVSDEAGHSAAEKPTGHDWRRSDPKFPDSAPG